jgi:hypothetical protein
VVATAAAAPTTAPAARSFGESAAPTTAPEIAREERKRACAGRREGQLVGHELRGRQGLQRSRHAPDALRPEYSLPLLFLQREQRWSMAVRPPERPPNAAAANKL